MNSDEYSITPFQQLQAASPGCTVDINIYLRGVYQHHVWFEAALLKRFEVTAHWGFAKSLCETFYSFRDTGNLTHSHPRGTKHNFSFYDLGFKSEKKVKCIPPSYWLSG